MGSLTELDNAIALIYPKRVHVGHRVAAADPGGGGSAAPRERKPKVKPVARAKDADERGPVKEKLRKRARTDNAAPDDASAGAGAGVTATGDGDGASAREGKRARTADDGKRPGKAADGSEPRVVFVKNLAFKATEASVRAFFAQAGTVTAVRLLTGPKGAPRGLGYVEFSDEVRGRVCVGGRRTSRAPGERCESGGTVWRHHRRARGRGNCVNVQVGAHAFCGCTGGKRGCERWRRRWRWRRWQWRRFWSQRGATCCGPSSQF